MSLQEPTSLPGIDGIEAFIAAREAEIGPKPGTESRFIWAGAPATRAPLALVYLHGFSASPREADPVPERLAAALGATLFAPRLEGHGLSGEDLADATFEGWMAETRAALAIGQMLGERVLLIGYSTGCPLMLLALAEAPASAEALILISPNFAMRSPVLQGVLDLPGVTSWGPWIFGHERQMEVLSPEHEAHFTTRYPMRAVGPMAAAIRACRRLDMGAFNQPALFVYSMADKVVSPKSTQRVLARWGGAAAQLQLTMQPGDDDQAHNIIGDLFSPSQTESALAALLAFAETHLDLPA